MLNSDTEVVHALPVFAHTLLWRTDEHTRKDKSPGDSAFSLKHQL